MLSKECFEPLPPTVSSESMLFVPGEKFPQENTPTVERLLIPATLGVISNLACNLPSSPEELKLELERRALAGLTLATITAISLAVFKVNPARLALNSLGNLAERKKARFVLGTLPFTGSFCLGLIFPEIATRFCGIAMILSAGALSLASRRRKERAAGIPSRETRKK